MSRPEVGNDDGEVVRFGVGDGGKKLVKKSGKSSKGLKLSKLGNLKDKNLAKSKKLSKNKNSSNFDDKKAGSSFLTLKARAIFNCLRLAFTKASIL